MMVEMKVAGITIDPLTSTPIVILKDLEEKKAIPIWIGLFEASAIATRLENVTFSRPMTHDLLKNVIERLNARLLKIEINDLKNNTYFAEMHLVRDDEVIIIDSRPSDAIAVALRMEAPIYVEESVIERSRNVDIGEQSEDFKKLRDEKLIEFLENLSPEDFGKYKM
ncbi:MAG TPA: bifunctional nuclease family protein [Syntrophales bacterium]|nr:bifunctional nuclease family protein [Syntrophales bacterium]HOL58580.1 bifunctional nuclease family protein [Syntrophales bacterium]HPO34812.1 bifunctional nuclease family protein [Syntrophales bacterium]